VVRLFSPHIEIRWDYASWMEKFHGMGLKPLVIIFLNPLAEDRGNACDWS